MPEPRLLPESRAAVDAEAEASVLRHKVARLEGDLQDMRDALFAEREKNSATNRALARLRTQLQPLYDAFRGIFGELEIAGAATAAAADPSNGPLDPALWAPWKEKFRGKCAEMIDALLKYENGLTRAQLMRFTGQQSGGAFTQNIFKLNSANLIEKDGDTIRLRRL
jgi:hypothetical protein